VLARGSDGYRAAMAELKPILEDGVEIAVPRLCEEDVFKLERSVKVAALAALIPFVD
jgi:hypothetical protein